MGPDILSYPIMSYHVLSCPILSYPILSYPILSLQGAGFPCRSGNALFAFGRHSLVTTIGKHSSVTPVGRYPLVYSFIRQQGLQESHCRQGRSLSR
jgi:hypothetical protein